MCVLGDFNVDIAGMATNVADDRKAMLAEVLERAGLAWARDESREIHTNPWTCKWRHPNGDEHLRWLDWAAAENETWSATTSRKVTRSDHQPVFVVRRGRLGRGITTRADARTWLAKQRGWKPHDWKEQAKIAEIISRAMHGASSTSEVQQALEAAASQVRPPDKAAGWAADDDPLRERLDRLLAKRAALQARASATTCAGDRARCARGAWRARIAAKSVPSRHCGRRR